MELLKRPIKPDKVAVGKRINAARIKRNFSIAELAFQIGISKSTLNSYIRGLALAPKISLMRIAVITESDFSVLLWGEKTKTCEACGELVTESVCYVCAAANYNDFLGLLKIVNDCEFSSLDNKRKIEAILKEELEHATQLTTIKYKSAIKEQFKNI